MNDQSEILPAVAAVIFNSAGQVLLQKRKDVDAWCIISGHVEFGETIIEAVLREIEEETDTSAEIVRFIGIYSAPSFQTYAYPDKTVQYVTSYFEARLKEALPLNFSNAETQELRFFEPHALPADLAQINPYWLADALNKGDGPFMR